MRLFDPACGCGNFLIIAYRELRTLEIDVLREIASRADQSGTTGRLCGPVQSVVDVDQFYGIEISEFPCPHCCDRAVDDGSHHEQRG